MNNEYEDIVAELANKFDTQYYIGICGNISETPSYNNGRNDPNNAYSKRQLEKVLAFNKLLTVAKYLNGNWELDNDSRIPKYFLCLSVDGGIVVTVGYSFHYGSPVFKTEELAYKAVEILGEDTINLALSNNY